MLYWILITIFCILQGQVNNVMFYKVVCILRGVQLNRNNKLSCAELSSKAELT